MSYSPALAQAAESLAKQTLGTSTTRGAEAMYRRGLLYLKKPRSGRRAIRWLKRAARQDYPQALYELANLCSYQKKERAWELYARAAELGLQRARDALLRCTDDEGYHDWAKAHRWRKKLACLGAASAECWFRLGMVYAYGLPPRSRRNLHAAKICFESAAARAHTFAMLELAKCYQHGHGMAEDPVGALAWYKKASKGKQGLAYACFAVSECYRYGVGVQEDEAAADKWRLRALARAKNYKHYTIPCLWQAAEIDCALSYQLGVSFCYGLDVARDHLFGLYWYRLAAACLKGAEYGWSESGWHVRAWGRAKKSWSLRAKQALQECYQSGLNSLARNPTEAAEWGIDAVESGSWRAVAGLLQLAQEGVQEAQFFLARLYKGKCWRKDIAKIDHEQAAYWLARAAEIGSSFARRELTCIRAVDNQEAAFRGYARAAAEGLGHARFRLGLAYEHGAGVAKCTNKAFECYSQAAAQGHARAQFKLGLWYLEGQVVQKDETQAVAWYRKAAEQGDMYAQNSLGACYAYGQGVEQDEAQAIEWYRQAAELGHAGAQNDLGICYMTGQRVGQDETQAVAWYRRAAEQGCAAAQSNLGRCYLQGKGVDRNEACAVKWYRQAAEQGCADAQRELGNCYFDGLGVDKNEAEAVEWFRRAAEQGDSVAQCWLDFHWPLLDCATAHELANEGACPPPACRPGAQTHQR